MGDNRIMEKIQLQKNQVYEITITSLGQEGQGVGRIGDMVVFVDEMLPQETGDIKIIKVQKNYAIGKLLKLKVQSSDRAEPPCPVYGKCGGCSMMHLRYPAQLAAKRERVASALQRIGGIPDAQSMVRDTLGAKEVYHYRNKAQYPFGGFYQKRSHFKVCTNQCLLQSPVADGIKNLVEAFVLDEKISIYQEERGKGLYRHTVIRQGRRTGEIMVILVINGKVFPKLQHLKEALLCAYPGIKSILINQNTRQTNVILGPESTLVYGRDFIEEQLLGLTFKISAHSFFQVNTHQAEVLYRTAILYADTQPEDTVFDLYCGTGSIGLCFARQVKELIGIEIVEQAVQDAVENAKRNGIENASFFAGKAEEVGPKLIAMGKRADIVILDPPRKGCDAGLLHSVARMAPRRIVYVSCDPATLARDVAILAEEGYLPQKAQPVDLFCQTHHVESVVLLTKVHK